MEMDARVLSKAGGDGLTPAEAVSGALPKAKPGAAPVVFYTTRFKRGNFAFPAMIEVTPTEVIRIKKYWFLSFRRRVAIRDIASIHIRNSQFSAEILFKDQHERHLLAIIGLFKPDAHRLRKLIEDNLGV